ncbi:Uma2 family endonuclease [Nonomuraea jiangxiensis]|uniref:Endonuclease, Uma2 family (Restriction endonuclease fold) n=1 Tax=Nonomuraea jiangxiensis TaxID=633440 RepID=A0A1G9M571_9ACTN|nr:Uma2 family endonuclease [Nonomuraea jiangxiensis]SDL69304.1 Endonuclease, Uma2 family (restriction endonuclease fold) [Nonomuraea jiangxiensis]
MTAEAPSLPDWVFPPPEGFVAEDLDHIPDLPAHTELIDGSLVFASFQRDFHHTALFRLHVQLEDLVPPGHEVRQEMSVKLGRQQRPEPDLIVIGPEAIIGREVTCFEAEDVVLAVEVVSPDSEVRDRERKPVLYAKAGIPHYWRIEEIGGKPAVFVYELDPATMTYASNGIYHDRLKLSVPFDIDIELTTLYQARTR